MVVTRDLARFIAKTSIERIPRDVVEHAKLCVLDWLGAALAGSLEPSTKIVVDLIRCFGGRPEATVIGSPIKTSCLFAALANGVMGHAIELDDIHAESVIHPAAPVVPAALACAERVDVGGGDLLLAVVLGYEVETRIGMAMMPSHYRYWHPTGTCGTFGAAAAAGRVLGLDEEGMADALGLAGTQASGLIEAFGTMGKPLNPGRAAMSGVLSAFLAKGGFDGPKRVLEGEGGFCGAVSEECDLTKITGGLGEGFEITRNIFKVHASCGHTHGAIDALLKIGRECGVKPGEVEEVVVGTYPIAIEVVGKNYNPKTSSEAKFSLPYCVAVALVFFRVGLAEFSPDRVGDPQILGLAKRVRVLETPEFRGVRLGGADVTVRLRDGSSHHCIVDVPRGYPENPLSRGELLDKFRGLATMVLSDRSVERIIQTVDCLEGVEKVSELTRMLST